MLVAAMLVGCRTRRCAAQSYPAKPLRMIVPFPPGGGTDILGRYLGLRLGEALGQQFIVENRGGANGTLGLDVAARAAPDGYTLVIGQTGNLTISPSLVKLGYDPARDFSPITLLVVSPLVLTIHPSLPARSVKELVALAKARPGQLSYASSGSGSPGHLGVESLKKMAGIDMVHIPTRGRVPDSPTSSPAHVQLYLTSMLSAQQFVKAGRVRVLAVGSAQRSPSVPHLPTIAESGYPGFEASQLVGRAGARRGGAGHRHPVERRGREGHEDCGRPRAHGRAGRRNRDRHARAVRRLHQVGNREMGQGDQGIRRPRGLK